MILKSGFGGAGAVSLATLTEQDVPLGAGMTLPLWVVETAGLAAVAGVLLLSERFRSTRGPSVRPVVTDEAAAPETP